MKSNFGPKKEPFPRFGHNKNNSLKTLRHFLVFIETVKTVFQSKGRTDIAEL